MLVWLMSPEGTPRSSRGAPDVVDELRRQARWSLPISPALAVALALLVVGIASLVVIIALG